MKQSKRINPRAKNGRFVSQKTSWFKFIMMILVAVGLFAGIGAFTGWMDAVNAPTPDIKPVESMEDITVFKPDFEAIIKSKVSEIWDGEKFVPVDEFELVKKVEASGPVKVETTFAEGQEGGKTVTGKASYYSADGCLGCHPEQIMANGEKFDENDYTLAIPAEWRREGILSLDTLVMVTNLDTGKRAVARTTDTGGFLKYNRIADLSKALAEEIGLQTDVSTIEIKVLPTLDRVVAN